MRTIPLTIREAEKYLKKYERHYIEPFERICAIGLADEEGKLHGAAIIGCNKDGEGGLAHIYADGVSQGYTLLYGACWRTLKAMGYRVSVL